MLYIILNLAAQYFVLQCFLKVPQIWSYLSGISFCYYVSFLLVDSIITRTFKSPHPNIDRSIFYLVMPPLVVVTHTTTYCPHEARESPDIQSEKIHHRDPNPGHPACYPKVLPLDQGDSFLTPEHSITNRKSSHTDRAFQVGTRNEKSKIYRYISTFMLRQ